MLPRDSARRDGGRAAAAPAPEVPNFIQVYPDALGRDQCADIVARFEADPRVRPSWGGRSDRPANRSGAMLAPGAYPEWAETVQLVKSAVRRRIDHYATVFTAVQRILMTDEWELSSPLIERIHPDQGFDWHFDASKHALLLRERMDDEPSPLGDPIAFGDLVEPERHELSFSAH